MKEDEFVLVISLVQGSITEKEVLADLPSERAKEILAECVEIGYVKRIRGQYQLRFPVVHPEDEVRIAEVLQPVSECLREAQDEWQEKTVGLAKELGFDWLLEHQPDSVRKGFEGLIGLTRRMRTEGLIQPLPANSDPCWAMWAKVWKA